MLDWRMLAARSLGARALARPDTAELRRNAFESNEESSLQFEARMPPAVAARGWLLVHERGAEPMPSLVLRGTVTYTIRVDSLITVVGDPRVSGRGCAYAAAAGRRPAFVLSGVPPSGWTSAEVTAAPAVLLGEHTVVLDGRRYTLRRTEISAPKPRRVILLRPPAARPLLLVTWESDARCERHCCEAAFDLLEVAEDRLVPLGQSAWGCDR
jgi:hypothetical protein